VQSPACASNNSRYSRDIPASSSIRQQILDLAVAAIVDCGEAAVCVNDFAFETGVTVPTL